jgi:hypothetical protein
MNCNHPHRSPWTASTATLSSRKHIFHPQCRNIHHHILARMSHRTLSCRTFPPLVQRFMLGSPQHESKCKHQGSMSTPCSYLDNCLGKPWGHTLWVFSVQSSTFGRTYCFSCFETGSVSFFRSAIQSSVVSHQQDQPHLVLKQEPRHGAQRSSQS